MLKTVVATLLAASALVPAIAQAQENDGDRRGPRGDRGGRPERVERPQQPRADMGVRPQRMEGRPDIQRGNWNRPQPAQQPAPQARIESRIEAQPQGQQQARQRRDDGQQRQGNWQSWRSERRDDRPAFQNGNRPDQQDARRVWQQRQQQQQTQRSWDRSDADWRDNDRDQYRRDDRRDWNRGGSYTDNRGWDNRGWQGNSGWSGNRGGNWNRGWRQDNRYDWNRYRTGNRGAFHLPRYYAPHGWDYGYRRFSIGFRLSPILFAQSYWIDDPYDYRLPEAYGPYRWVRYYNDALLVDLDTGEVVDTIYDIFW